MEAVKLAQLQRRIQAAAAKKQAAHHTHQDKDNESQRGATWERDGRGIKVDIYAVDLSYRLLIISIRIKAVYAWIRVTACCPRCPFTETGTGPGLRLASEPAGSTRRWLMLSRRRAFYCRFLGRKKQP